ncbi:hypothetical protein EBZ35_05790 [bacterium]|nr:hypothetical protein [bacterium]
MIPCLFSLLDGYWNDTVTHWVVSAHWSYLVWSHPCPHHPITHAGLPMTHYHADPVTKRVHSPLFPLFS